MASLLSFVRRLGKRVVEVLLSYNRRLGPLMAAGLAFYFLLGLIPFLFITIAISGYLFRRNPAAFEYLSTNLAGLLPPGLGEKILAQVQLTVNNWQTFGIFGLIALSLVAMGLFEAIDWGINGAMGTRKKVGFLKGRLLFLAYVTGAVLFFSVAAVTDYSLDLLTQISALENIKAHIPRRAFSMGVFAVFLVILYVTIPVRTPKVTRAIVISLVIAAIWAVLQMAGASITAHISRRHALYGALAGGTVFLTWMYLLAFLILLGATVLEVWERAALKRR